MKKNKLLKVLSAAALATSLAAVDLNLNNTTHSNFAYAADEASKVVEVPAMLHHFYENKASMGNAALSKVTVEKVANGYKYSVHWHDMEFSNTTDGISKFWVEGNEVALTADPTGTGPNPKVAVFTLPELKNRIDVEVFVNAMEKLQAGSGKAKAYLQLDTSAAKSEFDKQAQSTKRVVVRHETIPFETERVENKNMPKGAEVTRQEGKNGSVDIVRDDVYEGDKLVKQGEEKQVNRVEPVKKIVMYGTKEGSTTPTTEAPKDHVAENVTVNGTSTATGSFQQANDNSKPSAYNSTLVPEVKVEKVDNNYKYTFQVQPANFMGSSFELEAISYNGKELTMKELDATKKIKEVTLTTSELFDKLQLAGTVTYPNGMGRMTHPMTLVLKDFTPLPQTTQRVTLRTETIPFETERRNNANLPKGQEKVVQEGKNGSVDIVRDDIYEGNIRVKQGEEKQVNRVEPVNRIVEVGTKVDTPTPAATTYNVYTGVKPTLMHAYEAGRFSMGNAALVKTDVYKDGDTYHYSVFFKDLVFNGRTDGITRFWVNGKEVPVMLTGGAGNEVVANFTSTEKLTTLPVSVFVQVMEDIMPGGGKQNATLKFNWDNVEETTVTTKPKEVTGPVVKAKRKTPIPTPTPTPRNPGSQTPGNPGANPTPQSGRLVDATIYDDLEVTLMHAHEAGRLSMGAAAVDYVKAYKVGDTYHYEIYFKDLHVGTLTDGITRFWVNGVEYPVVRTGGANNQVRVHFTSSEQLTQVPVSVFVQTMENIMPGGGKQDAILTFNWSNVKPRQGQVMIPDDAAGTPTPTSSLTPTGGRFNNGRLANTGLETSSSIFAGIVTLAGAFFLSRKKEK